MSKADTRIKETAGNLTPQVSRIASRDLDHLWMQGRKLLL
jgi:hypothetical protein